MIIEETIDNLPTPLFKIKKTDEPRSRNLNLPPLFFSCLIVGSKNSGKSAYHNPFSLMNPKFLISDLFEGE